MAYQRHAKHAPYRSGFEVKIAAGLKRRGIPFQYEEDTLPCVVEVPKNYCGTCGGVDIRQKTVYTPDFKIADNLYVEGKGRMTAKERRRIMGVIQSNPGIDFRLLFMRNNPIYPRSKTKYVAWAHSMGIKAHCDNQGEIPEEWATEFLPTRRKKRAKK